MRMTFMVKLFVLVMARTDMANVSAAVGKAGSPEMVAMTLGREVNGCGNVTVKFVATVLELGMIVWPD